TDCPLYLAGCSFMTLIDANAQLDVLPASMLFQTFASWHLRCHAENVMGSSDVNSNLLDLTMQVQDLQRRVSSLEQRLAGAVTHPPPPEPPQIPPLPDVPAVPHLPPDILPVLGRALVAIAGAYVLRALTMRTWRPQLSRPFRHTNECIWAAESR